jgi:hypothetical protein
LASGTTHYSILDRVDLLQAVILPFLEAPMPDTVAVERG